MEKLLSSELFLLILSLLGAILASTSVLRIFLNKDRIKKPSTKEKIFQTIDKKFDSDLIDGKDDILILLNSMSRETDNYYSIAPVLEDYITNRMEITDAKDSEKIKKRYNLLKTIIEEETKEKPYEDVPDEERRLLVSIKDALKNNDTNSIEFNLQELHSVISTRNRIYERANRINKWSIPLAVIGTFFTVLFGIISLTPNIDYIKIEEMNKKLIKSINVQNDSIKNTITVPNKVYKP